MSCQIIKNNLQHFFLFLWLVVLGDTTCAVKIVLDKAGKIRRKCQVPLSSLNVSAVASHAT